MKINSKRLFSKGSRCSKAGFRGKKREVPFYPHVLTPLLIRQHLVTILGSSPFMFRC